MRDPAIRLSGGHTAPIPADSLPVVRAGTDPWPRCCAACGGTLLDRETDESGLDRAETVRCCHCGRDVARVVRVPAARAGDVPVVDADRPIACLNGHPWTPETTYLYPPSSRRAGRRDCRICRATRRPR